MPINEILGLIAIFAGVFFVFVGIIGLIRMPDVYGRIHATGKVATLGIMGILIGTAFFQPGEALKAIVLLLFLLITAPSASYSIAVAAHRQGTPRELCERDDLAEATESKPERQDMVAS
jgi:multicomponent Na+:H+ antiporter subunit G